MVLSNGFISQTKEEVIQELRKRIKGTEVQPIPLPYIVDTMTYYPNYTLKANSKSISMIKYIITNF